MNNSKTLAVARREFLYHVTRREFLFLLLGLPLFILLISGIQFLGAGALESSSLDGSRVGVFDQADLRLSAPNLTAYASQEALAQALAERRIDRGLVIPSDYWQTGQLTILKRSGDWSMHSFDEQAQALVRASLATRAPPSLATRLLEPARFQTLEVDVQGRPSGPADLTPLLGVGIGMVMILSIFMSSGYLLRSVVDEKENRLIEILLSSVSAQELMVGKILGLALLTLTQVLVWSLLALAIVSLALSGAFPLDPLRLAGLLFTPSGILAYALLPLGAFLLFSSLLAGLGSVATSLRSIQSLSSIAILPAVCPLWLVSLFMADPASPICVLLSLFPLSAPLAMMLRLAFGAVPIEQLLLSTLLVWASAWFASWASAKVFRTSLLIYGKTPSLRELIALLQHS